MYQAQISELENEIASCKANIDMWEKEGDHYSSIGYADTASAKWEYAATERFFLKGYEAELAYTKKLQAAYDSQWLAFQDADQPFEGGRFGTSKTYQQQRIESEYRVIDRKRSGIDARGNAYYIRMLKIDADYREWSVFMECN